jgi:streptomycin 6-kinase
VAIDPKGVLGEPAFEPAAFLRNPYTTIYSQPDLVGLMRSRIRVFAEGLGLPAYRIWAWGVAQNTLSASWCPPEERQQPMTVVEAIRQAKP